MIETPTHPAASTEFLSRRHDGDLSAADLAAFEAHRRECPECAAAVEDFDRALEAFREADVAPAASDISARILRKIRATSPSRRPFGVMFGIDVRWAGALAAALLVVIIMAPVFSRREYRFGPPQPPAPEAPIAAYVLDADADAEDAPAREKSSAPPAAARPKANKEESSAARGAVDLDSYASAPAEPPAQARDNAHANASELDATKLVGGVAAGARADAPSSPAAPPASSVRPEKPAATQFSRRQSAAAPAGGEAAAEGFLEAVPELRLSVRAVDGQGSAPEVVRTPTEASLAELKGREFLLVVESGGKVRFVEERLRERKHDGEDKSAPLEKSKDSRYSAEEVLKQLAFHPGDRSRRLVVTVEYFE